MNKKKLLAIVLALAMALAVVGLAACGKKKPPTQPQLTYTEEGTMYNGVAPKTGTQAKADSRAKAYSAYCGNDKIGDYTTLAAAVNAAIEYDFTEETFSVKDAEQGKLQGSYVTKLDDKDGLRYFDNHNGYDPDKPDYSSDNRNAFWYYEDGNKLNGYGGDPAGSMINILKDSNDVVLEVAQNGEMSTQYYSGYGALDEKGDDATNSVTVNDWELSTTMDSAIIQFNSREDGVGGPGVDGIDYKLDLTQVKVTPPYGEEDTYAYIGVYTWQPYYVIALGLACNTKTGNWYPFQATSRNSSFSDAEYDLGDTCIFTSTWNDAGYFTPDADWLTISARTEIMIDEEGDEYQENHYTFEASNGAKYLRKLTDSNCGEFFPGTPLGWDNGYHFIAGLDIRNKIANNNKTVLTDYTNGSKFENLIVEEATVHFGGDDLQRLTSKIIKEDFKDQDFNVVMAGGEHKSGAAYFTLLNVKAFVNYQAKDGKDVYSFNYDKGATASKHYGSTVAQFQDEIDALANIEDEDVLAETTTEKLNTIQTWLEDEKGVSCANRVRNVLDRTEYEALQEKVTTMATLSPEAMAARDKFRTLSILNNYTFKGWKAPEGTAPAGYLRDELDVFGEVKAAIDGFKAEGSDDAKAIFFHISEKNYNQWKELYNQVNELLDSPAFQAVSFQALKWQKAPEMMTYDGEAALSLVLERLFAIINCQPYEAGGKQVVNTGMWFTEGYPANFQGANDHQMDSDRHWDSSFMISYALIKLDEAGVNVKKVKYFEALLDQVGYYRYDVDKNVFLDIEYLYKVLNLYKYITDNNLDYIDAHVAEVINTVMLPKTKWSDGGLNYMWWDAYNNSTAEQQEASRAKNFGNRGTKWLQCFGFAEKDLIEYLKPIHALITAAGGTINEYKLGPTAAVTAATIDIDEATQALVDQAKALSNFANYDYKGWTTTETDKKGYVFDEYEIVCGIMEKLNADNTKNFRLGLGTSLSNYDAWATAATQITALVTTDGFGEAEAAAFQDFIDALYKQELALTLANTDANAVKLGKSATALSGFTLPEFLSTKLAKAGWANYNNTVYGPVAGAVTFGEIGNDFVFSTLSDDQLDYLNAYWVNGYTYSAALLADLALETGAKADVIAQTLTGDNTATAKTYFAAIVKLLTDNGYTMNEGTFTVTESTIIAVELSDDAKAVLNDVNAMTAKKLGDFKIYLTSAWTATGEQNVHHYFGSELAFANTVYGNYNGLPAEQKKALQLAGLNVADLKEWADTYDEFNAFFTANADVTVFAAKPWMESRNQYTVDIYEAMWDILRYMDFVGAKVGNAQTAYDGTNLNDDNNKGLKLNAGEADMTNGAYPENTFNSNISWGPGWRIIYLMEELKYKGIERTDMPQIVSDLWTVVNGGPNGAKFVHDMKYFYGLFRLARLIEDGADSITEEVAYIINTYLIGEGADKKVEMQEGGVNYCLVNHPSNIAGTNGYNMAYRDVKTPFYYFWFGSGAAIWSNKDAVVSYSGLMQTVEKWLKAQLGVDKVTTNPSPVQAALTFPAVKETVTANHVTKTTYTGPSGDKYLLPTDLTEWDIPSGKATTLDVNKRGVTVNTPGINGQLVDPENYYFVTANVNKTFTVANNKLFFLIGAGWMTRTYDIYIGVKVGEGEEKMVAIRGDIDGNVANGQTTYLYQQWGDGLDVNGKHTTSGFDANSQGHKSALPLDVLMTKAGLTGTEVTITKVQVLIAGRTTIYINDMYVNDVEYVMPTEPQGVNFAPTTADAWVEDQGDATVNVTGGVTTITSTKASDWSYSHKLNMDIALKADTVLYLDIESPTAEDEADILFYDANGKYANLSRVITGQGGAKLVAGKYSIKGSDIIAWMANAGNKGYTGEETAISLAYLRAYVNAGKTLKINKIIVVGDYMTMNEYLYGNAGTSFAPTTADAWVEDQGDATVNVTGGVTTITSTKASDWTYSHKLNMDIVLKADTVLYLDIESPTAEDEADILFYDANGKYANLSRVITGQGGAKLVAGKYAIKGSDIIAWMANAGNKGYTGEETAITLAYLRSYENAGKTLKINAIRVVGDYMTMAEYLYGNAGTSALTGITAATDLKTAYVKPGEDRTYDLKQETADVEVDATTHAITVLETGANIYSYSIQTNIKIERDTVLYYDLEGEGDGVDLVIWLSGENHYFNLCEVIKWKETGTAKVANQLFGHMKGYITGEDIINYLVVRGRSGWGYTSEAAPTIEEVGIYEIVVYLNNATLTINDLRVVGTFTSTATTPEA